MGALPSATVRAEVKTWEVDHDLGINRRLMEHNRSKLRFTSTLYFCRYQMSLEKRVLVRHYFVTDKSTILEFSQKGVCVHRDFPEEYHVEMVLPRTSKIDRCIDEVLGATNYSWLLRNSEHLAKYIAGQGWVSMQCVDGSPLYECFASYLKCRPEVKQLINTLPADLKFKTKIVRPVYHKGHAFIEYLGSPAFVDERDVMGAVNIVMLGPTGSGKSHLINLMCNRTVCASSNSVRSVTKHMQLIQGKRGLQKVNIIDTIGLCDTSISQSDVEKLIKQYIKATLIYIDKVVIVCSGRLTPQNVKAIKDFLVWLQYEKHQYNFAVLLTKSEDDTPEERNINILETCADLGIGAANQLVLDQAVSHQLPQLPSSWLKDRPLEHQPSAVKLNTSVGFRAMAPYSEIKDDLSEMLDAIFVTPDTKIRVEAQRCVLQ